MSSDFSDIAAVVLGVVGVGALAAILVSAWVRGSRDRKHRKIGRSARGNSTRVDLANSEAEPRNGGSSSSRKRRRRSAHTPRIDLFAAREDPEAPKS